MILRSIFRSFLNHQNHLYANNNGMTCHKLLTSIKCITTGQRLYSTSGKGPTGKSEGGSVFRKFAENVKKDTSDAELKESVQKFEEKLTELHQNESYKKAKEILSKAKEDVMRQNEAVVEDVKQKAKAVKNVVGAVSSKVGETISTAAEPVRALGEKIKPYVPDISESKVVKQVGKTVSKAEEKILEDTNIYQYGGFKTKELRDKTRAKIEAEGDNNPLQQKPVEADPEAGANLVLHKESKWASKWNNFVENNSLLQKAFGAKRAYEESNNIFVYFAREFTNSISDRISSVFSENETAKAMREIQSRDPNFHIEKFMKFTTDVIVPEILDAFVSGDLITLRMWCSEAMFNMLKANFDTQLKPGCRLEGRVLDMRNLELITAKLLEGETPVVVFSFNTQQISYMRNSSGEIVDGSEDNIENVLYVMALAKEEMPTSGIVNESTKGWKLVELAIRDKNGSW